MVRRAFDILVSGCGIVMLSPLLLAIAVWIKLDSPGPVFYRGKRAGRRGEPFYIYKFRSMVLNADQIGGPSTADGDPRVTPSGDFIRRFKLDELPQLMSVLRGEMSLVGPRPEVYEKAAKFSEQERSTLEVRPGITDWASIWNSDEGGVLAGVADPDQAYEEVIKPIKLQLQLHYLSTRSLLGDCKIIWYTLLRLVRKDWIPRELKDYPTFAELRKEVERLITAQASPPLVDVATGGQPANRECRDYVDGR